MISDKSIMVECEMKGFLSLIMMWLVSKQALTGAEIASEIERRKDSRPSPGTIYPALKDLKEKGLLSVDKKKKIFAYNQRRKRTATSYTIIL